MWGPSVWEGGVYKKQVDASLALFMWNSVPVKEIGFVLLTLKMCHRETTEEQLLQTFNVSCWINNFTQQEDARKPLQMV